MSEPIYLSILKERQYYAIVWYMFKVHNPPPKCLLHPPCLSRCNLVVQGLQVQLPSQ